MNRRPGIDTHDPNFHLIVKLNIPFDGREAMVSTLRALAVVIAAKTAPDRVFGVLVDDDRYTVEPKTVGDFGLNLLVGFGLRFFLGPLETRPDEEVIPNFPPGGIFVARTPTRFDIRARVVPIYLRTMNATGDRGFVAKGLPKGTSEDVVDSAYQRWLSEGESDLVLLFEADNLFLVIDFWDAVRTEVVVPFKLNVSSVATGFQRGDGRDHTGWGDGIDNLQEKMKDPLYYRSKIYLPHPAPAYPGEPTTGRDDPRYDGGTYLVHRKYVEDLALWNSDSFHVIDRDGTTFHGEVAREHAIGRDRLGGHVIARSDSSRLVSEPDGAEVNLGYNESHVLKARGGSTAPFDGPFPPLALGETNVFNTQDIRIRRRGVNFCDLDPKTGAVTYGLHFMCFQNNIQQTGFEFINNIWLMNPNFRSSHDGLFDPDNGVLTPVDGCYYFIPPPYRHFPGEVFFD